MRTESRKSNIGLTKLELIVALLILAGILVFMALQFSSPPNRTPIDDAYAQIATQYQKTDSMISGEGMDSVKSFNLKETNVFGKNMEVYYRNDAANWQLRYIVPTEAICNELLVELAQDREHSPDAHVLSLDKATDFQCITPESESPYLNLEFAIEGN